MTGRIRALPNLITAARLVGCAPLIIFFSFGRHGAVLATYALLELLDQADGKIAMALGLRSRTGQYFDPFVDSVTHLCVFACLMSLGMLPVWMYLVMLVRELGLQFLRLLGALEGIEVGSHYAGKLKALVHAVVALVILTGLATGHPLLPNRPLLDLAVLASILSGLVYLHRYRAVLRVSFSTGGV
jgi:CDP-diacylglycerol--glycerol-3-phosphate 3-phosphatidyltransferase